MNWQIFFSTFLLIFLAELGDKTQLAVMAQAAGTSSRWTIFAAGSLALILSTAVGVLAGSVLRRFVPDLSVIRVCGGVLFLIFGALMLADVVRRKGEQPAVESVAAPADWMSRHVIQHAAAFEEAAAERYRRLAAAERDAATRRLYEWLVLDEESHLNAMKSGLLVLDESGQIPVTEEMVKDMPSMHLMLASDTESGQSPGEELRDAIEGEEAQVQFYEALANHCKIPRLKETFNALATAERLHVKKLRALLDEDGYGRVD
jgi:Ca2+/H+ antiporter, TMEM165/GDT1 family